MSIRYAVDVASSPIDTSSTKEAAKMQTNNSTGSDDMQARNGLWVNDPVINGTDVIEVPVVVVGGGGRLETASQGIRCTPQYLEMV